MWDLLSLIYSDKYARGEVFDCVPSFVDPPRRRKRIGAMSRVCWVVVFIACLTRPNEARAQQPTFHGVLDRLEEHRAGF